jgi:hypothetical protein
MSEMAQALLMNPGKKNLTWEDGRVRVSLAGMKWVGTVHTPNGDKPLPDRIVSDETILVHGPLCKSNTDQRLSRLEPIFLSQEWYYLHDGSLRTPEPVDTSQSTAPPPMSPELVQFVNAWFMPAWDQAIDRLLRIKGALNTRMGGSVELLLQKGIIDPAVASWRAVQERLRGERTERSQRPRGGDVSELRADSPLGPRSSNYGQLAIRQ